MNYGIEDLERVTHGSHKGVSVCKPRDRRVIQKLPSTGYEGKGVNYET
jgi:hypothetical protein